MGARRFIDRRQALSKAWFYVNRVPLKVNLKLKPNLNQTKPKKVAPKHKDIRGHKAPKIKPALKVKRWILLRPQTLFLPMPYA